MNLVSIVMAARNEEELISKSLDSLINQTYRNIEIIIINDESTDNTEEIIKKYAEKNNLLTYCNTKHDHVGCVVPRVKGISLSRGDILFVVDADAYYSKDYIEKCLKHLKDPLTAGAVGKIRVLEPKTWISKCRDFHYRGRWNNIKNIQKEIKEGKIAPWIFKKSVYLEVGGYDTKLPYGEDRDFAKKILIKGYNIAYESETEWYHKWDEEILEVIRGQFQIGRRNFDFLRKERIEILKKLYFISIIPLFFLSIVENFYIILLIFNIGFLYLKSSKYLRFADKNKKYWILFPFYIYVTDVPSSLGFFYELFWRIFRFKK